MDNYDSALVRAFVSLGTSVDRIATFRKARQEFLARLPEEIRIGADEDDLVWRLIQIRKRGLLPKHRS